MKHNKWNRIFFKPDTGDGEGEQHIAEGGKAHVGEKTREFNKRFAPPPEALGIKPKSELPPEPPAAAEPVKPSGEVTPPPTPKPADKPKPFVRGKIEEAKQLQAKVAELETKIQGYETEKKDYETKVGDLQKRIDSGQLSASQEKQLQDRIDALVNEKKEVDEKYQSANKRLSFYNLQEDPDFIKEYIEPVMRAEKDARSVIAGNDEANAMLQNALILNRNAMEVADDSRRAELQQQRDALLETIMEGLPKPTQVRFERAVTDFIHNAQSHHDSLLDHAKTFKTVREEALRRGRKAAEQKVESWRSAYSTSAEKFRGDEEIPKEIAEKLEEMGITLDLQAEDARARRCFSEDGDQQEIITMLHRGRVQPVLVAKNQALMAIVKEQAETIAKLQGAGTGGGSGGGSGGGGGGLPARRQEGEVVNEQGQDRRAWQSKWAAKR